MPNASAVLEQLLVEPPLCLKLPDHLRLYLLTQGAPASTGSALCSVLANLAMNEEFRGSFARPFSPGAAAGGGVNGGRASTVAAVLVLVAGDMTVRFMRVVRFSSWRQATPNIVCCSAVEGFESREAVHQAPVEGILPDLRSRHTFHTSTGV